MIPVNHLEGHVMTTRFNQAHQSDQDKVNPRTVPLEKFPYVTLLITGKHTEIVLTRGVGLHTILGMTIDTAVGECLDKSYTFFQRYDKILQNPEMQQEFIERYNKRIKLSGKDLPLIPEGYFASFITNKEISRGRYLENLAKYGDPTEIELPLGLKNEQNADMSFTGVKTAIQSAVMIATHNLV